MTKIRLTLLDKTISQGGSNIRLDRDGNLLGERTGYRSYRCAITALILKRFHNTDLNYPEPIEGPYPYHRLYKQMRETSEAFEQAGISNVLPPKGVHALGIKKGVFLDLRNADILEEAAYEEGFSIQQQRILDFGSSSGRTVRTFYEAIPAEWHGVDPLRTSIEWARANFPDITFHVNDYQPPLEIESEYFNGVYAKSIWSHFGPKAAKSWIEEMHRILRPGGFLMFSVPGYHRLAERLAGEPFDWSIGVTKKVPSEEYLIELAESFLKNGFHFAPIEKRGEMKGITQWGTTFMRFDWVERELLRDLFVIKAMKPARTESSQDIYVCKRV